LVFAACFGLSLAGGIINAADPASSTKEQISDEALLTLVQRRTFHYCWEGAEPNSLATRERYHVDEPELDRYTVTSGGTGFGLMAMIVAIERGFVPRREVIARIERILRFLRAADRFHGVWPHWMDGRTGKVLPFSPKDDGGDLVETSFLAQGLLCVRQYFAKGNAHERKLARMADQLWRQIQWDWHRGPQQENVLFWHWSPQHDWAMNFRIRGYNECLITYVLAASSPTHPVPGEVYHAGWAEGGRIRGEVERHGFRLSLRHQGIENSCGPLFWAHYSFLGLDPRGLKDRYADYWQENRNHVRMIHAHCAKNPHRYPGYGAKCWGLSSSYSPNGYHGHCPTADNGTITPTAALASFPYEPALSKDAMRYFYEELGDKTFGKYGFYDAFNAKENWYPQRYLAIDQLPIVCMIENHRSGLLWNLFMSSPDIQDGLEKLEFSFRSD
jgi:hypothetical protein